MTIFDWFWMSNENKYKVLGIDAFIVFFTSRFFHIKTIPKATKESTYKIFKNIILAKASINNSTKKKIFDIFRFSY